MDIKGRFKIGVITNCTTVLLGVNMMDLQKLRKNPASRAKTPGVTKQKTKKKNEIPVPSSGKILNYLVRKKGTKENDNALKSGNKEDNQRERRRKRRIK